MSSCAAYLLNFKQNLPAKHNDGRYSDPDPEESEHLPAAPDRSAPDEDKTGSKGCILTGYRMMPVFL